MAKVIILNAPPGAGKDTLGNLIKESVPEVRLLSFKKPMFYIAQAMLGNYKYNKFLQWYNHRNMKERPCGFLNGKSPREFMIWISEEVIKPQFGNDYFGKLLAETASDSDAPCVVTDGGFIDEIIPIVEFGHEVHILRLFRDGYDFEGDSRSYIDCVDGCYENEYGLVDGYPEMTARHIIEDCLK